MTRLFKFTTSRTETDWRDTVVGEWEITAHYSYTPGRPATPPAYDHGGLPPDPPEVDFHKIEVNGEEVPYSRRLPDGTREWDWWADWLILKHEDALIAAAEDTLGAEYDAAMDRKYQEITDRMKCVRLPMTDFYMTDEPLLDFTMLKRRAEVGAAAGAVQTPDASAAVLLARYISDRRSEAWRSWRRSEASRKFLKQWAVVR